MPDRPLDLVDSWPVAHASAAIVVAGDTVATRGDRKFSYRLASISKMMTAWAVLVAVEEGIVDLDENVGPATLRQLLSHAGGFGFDGDAPIMPPGRRRIYSNTGIELAAADVARRSDMTFDRYLTEAVLEPLAMDNTALHGSPAHAIWSDLDDTCRFVAELMRPTLVSRPLADEATSIQFPELGGVVPGLGSFHPNPWGLGIEIRGGKSPHWTGDSNSARTFGHFGGSGTMAWVDPAVDVALVALTDRPFDEWAAEALRRWPELSDAVLS